MTVLVFIVVLVALAYVLTRPVVRKELEARLRGAVRRSAYELGMTDPRIVQQEVLAVVRRRAARSIGGQYLPTHVVVSMSNADFGAISALTGNLAIEIEDEIKRLGTPGPEHSASPEPYILVGDPRVSFRADAEIADAGLGVQVFFLTNTDDQVAPTQPPVPSVTDLSEFPTEKLAPGSALLEVRFPGTVQCFPLISGSNLVGRSPTCDVQLDNPGVSREHARIQVGADEIEIADIQSSTGTSINGDRIPEAEKARRITEEDEIQFGSRVKARVVQGFAST